MKIDVIGDVHGCYKELNHLIDKLGYMLENGTYTHPQQRRLVFLGDITDRGPDSLKTIELVYKLVHQDNIAEYVPGNHCNKLYRYFLGNNVQIRHGLETTVAELEAYSADEQDLIRDKFIQLYEQAELYLQMKPLNAVIAHAGIKAEYIGRDDKKVRTFVFYGDITGEKLADGRPVRLDWAKHYNGDVWIIYGHTPVIEPRFINKTVNIDLGCVFGNKLAAFQLPEENTVTVTSKQPYQPEKFTSYI
ncbi:bis(5'-nucleosyl)-tetraphosphatase PrpE [Amphibacillus jilinensis]|uniref:bis(5'-nucleosyl)-tetraphosphatase PrpE n=1 Tax=Amphibacillus jilinensis TaxID=1216008 RepID=UPI0004747AF1|nr:bis(5'-nucleosyl)-tetraphosphatase PrpE [Amphibacillus jilinensis]